MHFVHTPVINLKKFEHYVSLASFGVKVRFPSTERRTATVARRTRRKRKADECKRWLVRAQRASQIILPPAYADTPQTQLSRRRVVANDIESVVNRGKRPGGGVTLWRRIKRIEDVHHRS